MKIIAIGVLASFAMTAFAQTPTTTTPTTTADLSTPLAACKTLVTTAQSGKYEDIAKVTTGHHKAMRGKSKFNKMNGYMDKLKTLTCAAETIAADRAVVTAKSTEGERLVPFIKDESGWKFDPKTYRAFYSDMKMGMGKRGKKGKM